MIDTSTFTSRTIKITTQLSNGQVVTFSSTHYTKCVVTKLTREKCPESLAVELLREGGMCYS